MRITPILLVTLVFNACVQGADYQPRDGDIVFQTSRSSQSLAIQLATKSRYSHMGIVYMIEGKPYVFEAIQPVKLTLLSEWIERGERGHIVVKRHRDSASLLTPQVVKRMRTVGKALIGKDYDLYFEWSDDRIYCSELVWKVYDRGAGIRLGELETIEDFDLSHQAVQAKIKERFGGSIPVSEIVISPAAIFNDPMLKAVYSN